VKFKRKFEFHWHIDAFFDILSCIC